MKVKGQRAHKTLIYNQSKLGKLNNLPETFTYYNELFNTGNEYYLKNIRLMCRNIIYISLSMGLTVRQMVYYYDCFRGHSKFTLMPVVNFINAFNVDASLIFNHDLISEAIQSGTLLVGFNPETYRMASDNW